MTVKWRFNSFFQFLFLIAIASFYLTTYKKSEPYKIDFFFNHTILNYGACIPLIKKTTKKNNK
jgi:hypothetical protein